MKHFAGILISYLFFTHVCLGENQDISQKDLDTLIAKDEWLEVIHRAKEIPPSQRQGAWESSVTKALLLFLDEVENSTTEFDALDSLDYVFTQYSSFLKSPQIVPRLKASTLNLLKNCYDNNFRSGYGQYCTPFFINHFNKLPQDPSYLLEVGEYIRRSNGNAQSLLFFERSVKIDNSETQCNHTGLYSAADWAMRLPSNEQNHTSLSKKILFHHCWDYFKEELIEDAVYGEGPYLKNICNGLNEKQIKFPKESKC
jgi:hypothetical protein